MDPVFDAQYLPMKDKFSDENIKIAVAYTPAGEVDYIYVAGQVLVVDTDDNINRLWGTLDSPPHDERRFRRLAGNLVVFLLEDLERERFTVPEFLDRVQKKLGDDFLAPDTGEPLAAPVHVLHTAKVCAASEPAGPGGSPLPWPPVQGNRGDQRLVRLVISDTGLLQDFLPGTLDADRYPWLVGVDGDQRADELGRILPRGLPGIPAQGQWRSIPFEAGHGTFVAGVARSMAPRASVYVGNHFTMNGGALEYEVIRGLEELVRNQEPHVVNVPAGGYTRKDLPPLSFSDFHRRHQDITLVAAAGNDSTDRPFWPAAFEWTTGVGALGADLENLAYYSNYGDWVDVYALGEGLVNAYATGVYTYQEPPKRPTQQVFRGWARWDGTSFASGLVAGLIAAEIARGGDVSGLTAEERARVAREAKERVLESARDIHGIGPAVFPRDMG
jgi:hypothetical protein